MDEQDPVVCVGGRGHFLFSSYFQVSLVCLRLKPETNREEKKLITVKGTYTPLRHIRIIKVRFLTIEHFIIDRFCFNEHLRVLDLI